MTTRRTIRARLTGLYAVMFFAACTVVLTVNVLFVYMALTSVPPEQLRQRLADRLDAAGLTDMAPFLTQPDLPDERGEAFEVVRREFVGLLATVMVRQSVVTLTLVGVGTTALAWFVAGRALRPLQQITATATRLSGSTLSERIDLHGPDDELKELADTIDAMLGRLQRAFVSQRRFVANASHELRTPLSIMATEVDVTLGDPDATVEDLRAMGRTVRAAADRSEALLDDLLTLASSERLRDTEQVDLEQLTIDTIRRHTTGITARRLRLDTQMQPTAVAGHRGLLERLIDNLVENAIRHNREHGWISIHLSAEHDAVRLQVANSGRTIPPDRIRTLLEPFSRLERRAVGPDAGGFGLGLSIVNAIVGAHGGVVELDPVDGGGLQVDIVLPRGDPEVM